MAHELIILIGDNVTLKVRVEDHKESFDHQWLHLLTAFIIVLCTLLLLLTILAVYLCSPETKPSNSKLTTLINLLVTASYSECLFGRTLSLVFAIIYVNTPPHQILCRLSTASSIFFALMTSLSINGIAMPKIFRTSLSMWMLLVLATALTIPFFFIPTSAAVTFFFNRNDCQVFGKTTNYYILAITIFVFIPSWIGMINFLITYKFIKCRSNYLGIDDLRDTDGRFVVLLMLLYILLVIPNIISIIIDELIKYNEIIVIKDQKLRSITSWLSIVFLFLWPCLLLYMYPTIGTAFKTLMLDCRNVRNFSSTKNDYCDSSTPVLMATSDGLFLCNAGYNDKHSDLTLINNDLSSKNSKKTPAHFRNVQEEEEEEEEHGINRKMVRFAFHVTHIPEASTAYQSLPSCHSSTSSSF